MWCARQWQNHWDSSNLFVCFHELYLNLTYSIGKQNVCNIKDLMTNTSMVFIKRRSVKDQPSTICCYNQCLKFVVSIRMSNCHSNTQLLNNISLEIINITRDNFSITLLLRLDLLLRGIFITAILLLKDRN